MFEHKNDGILTLNVKELLIMHLFFTKNVIKIYKKDKKLSISFSTEKCIFRSLDDKYSLNYLHDQEKKTLQRCYQLNVYRLQV